MKKEWGFKEYNHSFSGSIPALTSLRFFAAFYVILFHAHDFSGVDLYALTNLFNSGYLAVDFFFILSGFILSYTYYPQIIEKSFSYSDFFIKRVARIYPVHIFTLLLMLVIITFIKLAGVTWSHDMETSNFYEFIKNILMVHSWAFYSNLSYNQPSWSISAEFFAYILFPIFIFSINRGKELFRIIFSITLFLSFYVIAYVFFEVIITKFTFTGVIIRIIPDFLLGVVSYMLFYKYSFTFDIGKQLIFANIALFFCFYLGSLDFIVIPLFAWVIYLLADQARHGEQSFLNNDILQYLGRISYSLYMVHFPVWIGFMHLFLGYYMGLNDGNVSLLTIYSVIIFTILVMFPCAMLTNKYVEEPSQRWLVGKLIKK